MQHHRKNNIYRNVGISDQCIHVTTKKKSYVSHWFAICLVQFFVYDEARGDPQGNLRKFYSDVCYKTQNNLGLI